MCSGSRSTRRAPAASSAGAPGCLWRTGCVRRMSSSPSDAFVAILAGGEGTRLWPLSRSRRPKQLLRLNGSRSLIQQTVDRIRPLVPSDRILIVTERSHAESLREQLPELPDSSIIAEATWASLHSDAFISNDDEFRRTLAAALEAAAQGEYLVTTGVRPRFAATGYGYIQLGDQIAAVHGFPLHRVVRFVEKPDQQTAE